VAAIARVGQISLDWLLGLREVEAQEVGLLTDSLSIERDAISPVDERLMQWHEEAAGYKIRHVPSTFPDVLKTEEVIASNTGTSSPSRRSGGSRSHAHGSTTSAVPRRIWKRRRPCM
jgi:hypothetical protein